MWGMNQSRSRMTPAPAPHGLCRLAELLPAVLEKYGVDRAAAGSLEDNGEWAEPIGCGQAELAGV